MRSVLIERRRTHLSERQPGFHRAGSGQNRGRLRHHQQLFAGALARAVISRALETGTIDGALVTGNFTSQFKRAGYGVLGELEKVPMMGNAVVVKQTFLQSQREFVRNFLRAIGEAQIFVLSPMKRPAVLRVLTQRLNVTNPAVAEDALQDLLKRLDKTPIPSIPALRNIQRFLQTQNPKVGQVNWKI